MSITFFDIPSTLKDNAWSPNTFKTRLSLNYKGIPHKTEWIEYPDIETSLKKSGGAPTSKKPDGRDHYTLPAIYDPATGKVVTDSIQIAAYLDDRYSDTPALIPSGTRAAIEIFNDFFEQKLGSIYPILLPASNNILNPPSEEYFRRTREELYKKKLEEFAPPGPARDELWEKFREGLDQVASFYDKNGANKPFFLGDTFTFADANVLGYLLWIKVVLGSDSKEWKAVGSWNGGRWANLVEVTKKWQVVN
ncbi:hypothetical protein EW145_g3059 [Phellinidium pouzarii]|uniref:GST N-terminal domain-containing protein n=1 Tax=Phellinidium pouzarii TaxID=167371 RepID=A0A4S4LAG5_9AGAM|nr:hypothetical protein EW145_g3059 [Phellinidium pouzarii]